MLRVTSFHAGVREQGAMSAARKDALTGAVTLGAIVMFVFTGSAVMPKAFDALAGIGGGADRMLVTALLLNLALIIFGWRRCHDLQLEIAERKRAEEQARQLASRDPLTGLLNRRSLAEMASALVEQGGAALNTALMIVDLDHFKEMNDLYGHAAGDALLRDVAAKIADCVPEAACCGRLGGDEFAILLLGDAAAPQQATRSAHEIVRRVSEPIEIDGALAHVGASVGIAELGDREDGLEALLRRADIAMYAAKRLGRNRCAWFDQSMESELGRRNTVEAGIRAGVATREATVR